LKASWKHVAVPVLLALLTSCSSATPTQTSMPSKPAVRPLVIAHRGARSLAPENTLAAARKALELGADMWELDVAVTADGELVVIHDDTLDRTCNVTEKFPGRVPWRVWEFTLAEIQTLDCGSWFNETDPFGQIEAGNVSAEEMASYAGEAAPTLRQALEFTAENDWRVNVELKDQPTEALGQTLVEKTVRLIEELGIEEGDQVVISSFNHAYLKSIRALNPQLSIQALTSKEIDNLPEYLAELGTHACNPKAGVWSPQELRELGQRGIEFNVWTVNDETEMRELIEANVHGIFTDFPQALAFVLDQME
jgi:glycerophosphoryl diester phosphodiesterase